MGNFGSTQAMITVLKNNKALLGNRKSLFRSKKDYISSKKTYSSISGEFFDYKTASPELLEEIRQKFIKERRKEAIKNGLLLAFIISVCIFLTYIFFISETNSLNKSSNEIKPKETKQFRLIIKDGDEWIDAGNYENAIIQYTRAAKLFPNQFEVEYRICLGYSYLCRYDQKECEKGKEIVLKTIEKYPNENKMKELVQFFSD
ncbi:hypothetical protein [Flavobacterium sp. UBA6135]|uniref:hypothetical protein n=1 Tax=Flavobacterium sp. UBA6135 TaxID=1946553 RepID=UPI0025BD247D|nr:hypothetical protein [Flavobacterium sp. UBA6135]